MHLQNVKQLIAVTKKMKNKTEERTKNIIIIVYKNNYHLLIKQTKVNTKRRKTYVLANSFD